MKKAFAVAVVPLFLTACYDPADNCKDDQSAKIGAFVASQSFVSKRLKSPSTAEYPYFSENGVIVNFERKCHFKVAGYVDAQNGFGATIRSRYVIDIEMDPVDGGYWGRNLIMD
jgi:hypothetical protein